MSDSLWLHGLQHSSLPSPSLSLRVCSNLCPLSWWCHPTISSSVTPFSSCHQSFPASGCFPMSRLFASGGHSIGASASASVLPKNIQGLFLSGLTGFIPLVSKGLSGVFPSTMVWKNQFCGAQPSLQCNCYIHHDHWENHSFAYTDQRIKSTWFHYWLSGGVHVQSYLFVLRWCLPWPMCSLGKTLLAFALVHFVL